MPGLAIVMGVGFTMASMGREPAAKGKTESHDWPTAMRELVKGFNGNPGMVVRLGDSITYANPGSAYLRYGKDRSPGQLAACRWMKADIKGKESGIWLSYSDQPTGRSHTAASGVTSGGFIKGGKGGLASLTDILESHRPQVACVLLGTNDITAGVSADQYGKNMDELVTRLMAGRTIPVIVTVPPIARSPEMAVAFNERLWSIALRHKLPVIDYHGEIMARRPTDWKGTLISQDGVHPSAHHPAGPATEENLGKCGYLLLGWATLNKLVEIKEKVIDPR